MMYAEFKRTWKGDRSHELSTLRSPHGKHGQSSMPDRGRGRMVCPRCKVTCFEQAFQITASAPLQKPWRAWRGWRRPQVTCRVMKVTKIILSRPLFRFEGNDTSKGITALKWQVIYESGNLLFQADEVSLVEIIPPMTRAALQGTLSGVAADASGGPAACGRASRTDAGIDQHHQGRPARLYLSRPHGGCLAPNLGLPAEPRLGKNAARNVWVTVMEGLPKSSLEESAFYRQLALGFEAVHDAAVVPSRVAQLELFKDEEQLHIQREINRKLWTPRLPNAGDLERKWLHWMRGFARDGTRCRSSRSRRGCMPPRLKNVCPRRSGCGSMARTSSCRAAIHVRRPVTLKTNKALFEAAHNLKQEAEAAKHRRKKWLAQFLLDGMPIAVSNFKMRVLYLLRHADGIVERLVKLMNIEGEESKGGVMGDGSILPNNMYAGSRNFGSRWGPWATSPGARKAARGTRSCSHCSGTSPKSWRTKK